MMRFLSLLVFIPVIVVIAAFSFRNAQMVSIDFFIVEFHIPLAAIILVALIVGAGLGFLANIFVVMAHKNTIRQLKKRHQTLGSLSDALKSDSRSGKP